LLKFAVEFLLVTLTQLLPLSSFIKVKSFAFTATSFEVYTILSYRCKQYVYRVRMQMGDISTHRILKEASSNSMPTTESTIGRKSMVDTLHP